MKTVTQFVSIKENIEDISVTGSTIRLKKQNLDNVKKCVKM